METTLELCTCVPNNITKGLFVPFQVNILYMQFCWLYMYNCFVWEKTVLAQYEQ